MPREIPLGWNASASPLAASLERIAEQTRIDRIAADTRYGAIFPRIDDAQLRRNRLTADRPPLPTDDIRQGFEPGSRWQCQGVEYFAASVAADYAVWLPLQVGEFPSREAAQAANIPAPISSITVDGLKFRRDPAGTALLTADGGRWFPDREWTDRHFVSNTMTIEQRTAALQAWAGPDAPTSISLLETHFIAGTLNLTNGRVVDINCGPSGAMIRTTDVPILDIMGDRISGQYTITSPVSKGSRQISTADAAAVQPGDWIMLRCNDATPGVSIGSRVGMLRKVESVGTDRINLDSVIYRDMTISPTFYTVALAREITIRGGRFESIDQENRTPLLRFFLAYGPKVQDTKYGNSGGAGLALINCVGGSWDRNHVYNLRNDAPNQHYGYGVSLGGACRGFMFNSGRVERVRHAITTGGAGTSNIPAHLRTLMEQRGEPEACFFGPVYCFDTTEAALDTHEQGYGIRITPNVHGCFTAVNIRCSDAFIDGGQITGSRRRAIRITDPATAALPTGPVKVTINGTVIDGVAPDGAGGVESFGVHVSRVGAEVLIINPRITGCRSAGVYAVEGATVILDGGLIDGGGISGAVGVDLRGGGSRARRTIIRGCATDVRQQPGMVNDIILTDEPWTGLVSATGVTTLELNTTQNIGSLVIPADKLLKRGEVLKARAYGTMLGTEGEKFFSMRLGNAGSWNLAGIGGAGSWVLETEIVAIDPLNVRAIMKLNTDAGQRIGAFTTDLSSERPWSLDLSVRHAVATELVTRNFYGISE